MDGKLFRELQESYYSVHEEDKKWIQGAIKKPGALHKELGVPEGEKIPASKLKAAAKKGGKEGQRARLAMTLKGFKKESFDVWVDALIEEGYDLTDFSPNELADLFEEGDCDSKEHEEEEKDEQKDRKKIRKMLDKEDEKEKEMGEEFVNEADSLAAMAARREKRLARQRKQMGTSATGQDFGHDYGISSDERKKRQKAEFDAFIGRGKKDKKDKKDTKEEVSFYDVILSHLLDEGYAETVAGAEGIMVNMSEEWRDDILEAYEPMTKERKMRVDSQKKKAYDKDMRASHSGDKEEADKQYKRRMAMDSRTKMRK